MKTECGDGGGGSDSDYVGGSSKNAFRLLFSFMLIPAKWLMLYKSCKNSLGRCMHSLV